MSSLLEKRQAHRQILKPTILPCDFGVSFTAHSKAPPITHEHNLFDATRDTSVGGVLGQAGCCGRPASRRAGIGCKCLEIGEQHRLLDLARHLLDE
jgi:hypothetical protein